MLSPQCFVEKLEREEDEGYLWIYWNTLFTLNFFRLCVPLTSSAECWFWTRSIKAFHFNSSILLTFHPKEFSAMFFILLCALNFDRIFYSDELWLTVTLHWSVMQKQHTSFLNICKSQFQGWWNKGKSGGINSSNCLLQKSMEVSGSRSLHRVLAALPKCKRPCGVGASCLSEQCHMNKLSEMGNRRRDQWVSHLPGLNWLLGSFSPFKSFRSQF